MTPEQWLDAHPYRPQDPEPSAYSPLFGTIVYLPEAQVGELFDRPATGPVDADQDGDEVLGLLRPGRRGRRWYKRERSAGWLERWQVPVRRWPRREDGALQFGAW